VALSTGLDPVVDPGPEDDARDGEELLADRRRDDDPIADVVGPVPAQERRALARTLDVAAVLLVLAALLVPDRLDRLTPVAFARLPLEAVVGAALVLVLPTRTGKVLAGLGGGLLGLLTLGTILDVGFFATLARPFDPVLDWVLAADAADFLTASIGPVGAIAAAVGTGLFAVGLVVATTRAALRLAGSVTRHRSWATAATGLLSVVWATCAIAGVDTSAGEPFAADRAATTSHDRVVQVSAGLADRRAFAAEASVDAFRGTPGSRLLTALRGRDVVLAFVESYGRSALEDPRIAGPTDALLDAADRRLEAEGFHARSAFLTSPTAGGGSWLAHSTLLSGLWIDNQQRYRNLVATDRLTLNTAFRTAGWRTVGVMPGVTRAWPEGSFYGYDQVYDARTLGYRGPHFSWAPMPDQYVLAAFRRLELLRQGRRPVMAEIPLVSSHAPWAPLPRLVGWSAVGDGSVFDAMAAAGERPDDVWRDASRVREAYAQSIRYSLDALLSYVGTYGDDNLVLVFLGDHQPAPIVTGDGASRDVPITIVARDPAVLDRVAPWGWQDGLRPRPEAPVWRMDTFRDRFLTAFGPRAG
jgi:hypothetical protein